jgi:hypothetical protein
MEGKNLKLSRKGSMNVYGHSRNYFRGMELRYTKISKGSKFGKR